MGDNCQAISLAGIDESWYSRNGTAQYLLLHRGGRVLLLRTLQPDDPRQFAQEFAALIDE